MKELRIKAAIFEAKRFLKAAEAVLEHEMDQYSGSYHYKYTAAARRSSMDLTRALADLRRPD